MRALGESRRGLEPHSALQHSKAQLGVFQERRELSGLPPVSTVRCRAAVRMGEQVRVPVKEMLSAPLVPPELQPPAVVLDLKA